MKKKVLLLALLSVFILTGCQAKQTTDNTPAQRAEMISKNQKKWNVKVNSAKKIDQSALKKAFTTVPQGYDDTEMSWSRLKNGNRYLVEGQVINLQPMLGRSYLTETKATIYVKKVIGGDKSLQGKLVKTVLPGGLAEAKDAYLDVNGQYIGKQFGITDPKTLTYATDVTSPLPRIGQELVIGLGKYQPENANREQMYAKFGLTTKNFYPLNNQDVTFWVKKKGKFYLNNPAFTEKKYPNLFKVTEILNRRL